MKTISDLEQEIRDLVNSPRKRALVEKDHAGWPKTVSSLDAIGDTEQALDQYLTMDEPATYGGKYLTLHGALQVLFLQQDAVEHLCEALGLPYTPDPRLKQIREVRNDSSGHPTKRRNDKAFGRISRTSMRERSYKLAISYPDADTDFSTVDVTKLIEDQRAILHKALSEVVEKLKEEEMKHREEFRDIKLAGLFSKSLGNDCDKIAEAIAGDLPADVGAGLIGSMLDGIRALKEELERRGILEAYGDAVAEYSRHLEHPLNELRGFFESPAESRPSTGVASALLPRVRKYMGEFAQMAEEIDEEYSAVL
jgi:hypothetical protein